jgi:serine/threonine protein kinase
VLHEAYATSSNGCEYWLSVEEYLPGGTLAQRLGTGPIDAPSVRQIGIPLADALGHFREKKLVHRDIKPANILFRSTGQPVLTDFGIVRMLDAPTLTHDFLPRGPGTPLYAAPEQLLNEKALIDWRTDQFCLALVLAECAIGYHPFAPERDLPLAVQRMATRQAIPAQASKDLTACGFAPLVKALALWPAERFRAPQAFIEALAGN